MATPYSLTRRVEVTSTQDIARQGFTGRPLLVVADRQTSGRGRAERTWETAPRAVAASLAVAPRWAAEQWGIIPLIAGLAGAETLGAAVRLKWPNDLLIDGDKVGGILVEASGTVVVIGCGVNLWWPDPPDGVAAVHSEDPGSGAADRFAAVWAESLLGRLDRPAEEWPRQAYRNRCVTLGRSITWEPAGAGVALDVAGDGSLVVETDLGDVVHLRSGEVHHVRTG